MTHTGIRRGLSMHSEHIYNVDFGCKRASIRNMCAYSDVVQTLVITGNKYLSKVPHESKKKIEAGNFTDVYQVTSQRNPAN